MRQQLSEIIARDMNDPRLAHIITIVNVGVSRDLKHAKVFTSVLGKLEERKAAVETLNNASGFMRRELIARLSMKTIPFLSFIQDDSIEQGSHLLNRISKVRSGDSPVEDTP